MNVTPPDPSRPLAHQLDTPHVPVRGSLRHWHVPYQAPTRRNARRYAPRCGPCTVPCNGPPNVSWQVPYEVAPAVVQPVAVFSTTPGLEPLQASVGTVVATVDHEMVGARV